MTFSIFKSRTFWTVVVMFVVGGGTAIDPVLPVAIQVPVMGLLGVAAIYFHINPSQPYNPPSSTVGQ